MNTFIRFATLQLHTGYDADHNTLSKTIAVYDQDQFVLPEGVIAGNVFLAIKKASRKTERQIKGEYNNLLPQFVWHLN